MEEQFNAHVAVIPETDQAALQLTTDIQALKDTLERMNLQINQLKAELGDVKKNRSELFLDYFNKVSVEMPVIYRELTG
jgi:chromosome segregation ATPase